MSSVYSTSLDSFVDPTATSKLNSPAHSTQHININDAVEKIEAKVGADSSAVTTSHDYKLSGVTGTDKAVSKTGTETLTTKTLTAPVITNPTITGTDSGAETLVTKTLTTPVIASFYQDAGLTKLMTAPDTASDTLTTLAATQTLTNKRITKRIGTEASSATSTPTADSVDQWNVTALAAADTFAAPSGTPTNGQTLIVRIKDNGTAQTLGFNAIYRFSTDLPKPTTTVLGKTIYLGFVYNAADSKWDCLCRLDNF
jgi:hypothetical protein